MILPDEGALSSLGERLATVVQPGDRIALTGGLGAGKTSLARAVIHALGYCEEVPSPTFAIVQQYEPPEVRFPIVHADFYRLEDPDEVRELGLEDMLDDAVLLAEWPDRLPASFWENALRLELEIESDNKRRLTWSAGPAWKDRWPLT